jgi:hypothetical protein
MRGYRLPASHRTTCLVGDYRFSSVQASTDRAGETIAITDTLYEKKNDRRARIAGQKLDVLPEGDIDFIAGAHPTTKI